MPASEARILANRQNARHSTGPKTAEGKARSRANGLKHGLTGAGIVLAEDDAAEVEVRAAELMAEFAPQTTVGQAMVGQLASLSIRMERAARQEEVAIAGRVRRAALAFDHDRIDRVEGLFDAIAEDPRRNLRNLKRMPEGVDRLVEAWEELRDVLARSARPRWDDSHRDLVAHLLGKRPEQVRGSHLDELGLAVRGEPAEIADPEWPALDPDARRGWAVARLVERIDREIAGLEEHRETLDLEVIELDRLDAPAIALFDSSREATLARRYESEASRRFFKALKELREVEAAAADRPAPNPVPAPVAVAVAPPAPRPEPLGSSCARPSPSPREPEPTSWELPEYANAPRDGAARGLDGRMIAIGLPGGLAR